MRTTYGQRITRDARRLAARRLVCSAQLPSLFAVRVLRALWTFLAVAILGCLIGAGSVALSPEGRPVFEQLVNGQLATTPDPPPPPRGAGCRFYTTQADAQNRLDSDPDLYQRYLDPDGDGVACPELGAPDETTPPPSPRHRTRSEQ